MEIIYSLISGFVLMGITEAIIKPLATRLTQRLVLKYAPQVFEKLDLLLPEAMNNPNDVDLDKFVRGEFSKESGKDCSNLNLNHFWKMYDPRANIARLSK